MSAEERTKWEAIHSERGFYPPEPSPLITACEEFLPGGDGRALDVAGGSGRHAFWLAELGYEVTLTDISPSALQIATEEAAKRAVTLRTVCADLERDPLPPGPWDVIVCFHYLHRPLFPGFARELSAQGVLLFVQPTHRNLERHQKPGARFLLEEGELATLAPQSGLEMISYGEAWSEGDRHEASLVARRSG